MTDAPRASLVVVAAGTGSRLGADRHKALVDLGGRPLVEVTLRRLLDAPGLDAFVLVVHPDDRPAMEDLVARLPREVTVVDGGARRQDSVAAGLAALDPGTKIVLVHDAARPFVPVARLPELVSAAQQDGCAILAVPVTDTIKEARDDDRARAARTVPRETLWAAQTPQAFRLPDLLSRLGDAERNGLSVTDEARLFETSGLSVRFVEGSRLNFKVTTPDDLRLARALLHSGRRTPQ